MSCLLRCHHFRGYTVNDHHEIFQEQLGTKDVFDLVQKDLGIEDYNGIS